MPTNIKKNMAPKPKKTDVYKKLPYKDDKLQAIKQDEPKSPFTLGSNRGNDTYSAFQAKGLISPMNIDPPKTAQEIANKNLETAEYTQDKSFVDPNDPNKKRFVAEATGTEKRKTFEEVGVDPAKGKAYWDANPDKYKEYLESKTATASKEKFTSTTKPTTPPTSGSTPPPKTPPAPGEGKFEGFVEKPKVGITQSRKSSDKDISKVKKKDKIKNPTPKAKILNGKGGFQNPMNRMKGTFSNLKGKQKLK